MSATPRTDAFLAEHPDGFGMAPFCRQLERELAEAKRELAVTEAANELMDDNVGPNGLVEEIDAALAKNPTAAVHNAVDTDSRAGQPQVGGGAAVGPNKPKWKSLADFIHNATEDEKREVYEVVMERASARQRTALTGVDHLLPGLELAAKLCDEQAGGWSAASVSPVRTERGKALATDAQMGAVNCAAAIRAHAANVRETGGKAELCKCPRGVCEGRKGTICETFEMYVPREPLSQIHSQEKP